MVYSFQEVQRRLIQTIVYKKFFLLWKETTHKPWKAVIAIAFFQCVYYWYNLLQWMFFIPCDISKLYFSLTNYSWCEVFFNYHAVAFFEASVLKEVCILDITSIITWKCYYQSSKIKLVYFTSFISLTNITSFILPHFVTAHFSLSTKFICKTKNSLKASFLQLCF